MAIILNKEQIKVLYDDLRERISLLHTQDASFTTEIADLWNEFSQYEWAQDYDIQELILYADDSYTVEAVNYSLDSLNGEDIASGEDEEYVSVETLNTVLDDIIGE